VVNRDRLDAFRLRFGLDLDPDAQNRFQIRVVHAATEALVSLDWKSRATLEKEFAFRNGSKFTTGRTVYMDPAVSHGIIEEFQASQPASKLIESVQHFLWAMEACGYILDSSNRSLQNTAGVMFVNRLEQAISLSPSVDLRLQRVAKAFELAPAGVPILDEAVDRAIEWLSRYPDVQKEFRQALTILAEQKVDQFRQAQDSLRFALEKLLKLLLNNTVPIEEQGKPLKEWMTSRGIHANLRDASVQVLGVLSKQYQNAAVKHDNTVAEGAAKSWSVYEVEYVVYQYAAIIRLLIEASESRN
jgi:hypothetical protein